MLSACILLLLLRKTYKPEQDEYILGQERLYEDGDDSCSALYALRHIE